jgi:PIN domain nuclease of toxin-antitoxin system
VSQAGVPEILPAYVLDASALLAQLNGEPGFDVVKALIQRSVISSVNWAEVLQKVIALGSREVRDVREDLASLGLQVLPFTEEDAELTARLWSTTRRAGLSLGDRACLSLAQKLGVPAISADRGWAALSLEVEVRLVR